MDDVSKAMEVIVDEDQFSLTIGRKGQNVRLASELLGWEITIKTDVQLREEQQNVVKLLLTLPKVSEVNANLLFAGGFHTLEDVAFGEIEAIQKSSGITDTEDVEKIQIAAKTALQEKLRNAPIEELENIQEEDGKVFEDDNVVEEEKI